ncbi:MAG TPA: hypothetical protein VE135_21390 [Pyrinomonadaceae bacterium]|nr:hypothetical protein [Pyrinomonadaceae bacterium]
MADADLRLLDEYRRSFNSVYERVVGLIRTELHLEPTGRPAKSTTSIVEKLQRESIRLTQVQDIAGCRLVVSDLASQEQVVASVRSLFDKVTVVDRRAQPSHGYRAMHVIAECEGKVVEIQIRTSLQHLWAEQSEKTADLFDPAIKYGGGRGDFQELLLKSSRLIADLEENEAELASIERWLSIAEKQTKRDGRISKSNR